MSTRLLIVDDEPLARQRLQRLLEDQGAIKIAGEAGNGDEALKQVAELQPDIVLLDIRMPGMDGLEAARRLAELSSPPAIIFCTAYDEYAIPAFKVSAVDYLLKPVRKDALLQAIQSARKINKVQLQQIQTQQNRQEMPEFIAKTLRGTEIIALDQIRYFMADQKYVTVYHQQGETITDTPLKQLESHYPSYFLRIHRNCLVNTLWIEGLERNRQGHFHVRLKPSTPHSPAEQLDVSRRHTAELKHWFESRQV